MWQALGEIAEREGLGINEVCTAVDAAKAADVTLTSAVRTLIASYFRKAATEEGHRSAGHGP